MKWFRLGCLGIALLGITSWWFLRGTKVPATQPFLLDLREGQVLAYKLDYQSEGHGKVQVTAGSAKDAVLAVPEQKASIKIDGEWLLKVQERDMSGYKLNFLLVPSAWAMESTAMKAAKPENIEGTLRLEADGRISSFQMGDSAYQSFGFIIADILSLMETRLPPGKLREWPGFERGFSQRIPVLFHLEKTLGNVVHLRKTYQAKAATEVSGESRFVVHKQNFFQEISAERHRQFSDSGSSTEDTTRLTLGALDNPVSDITSISSPATLVTETLDGEKFHKEVEESVHRRRLGKRTFADVKAVIEALPGQNQIAKTEAFMLLRSFIFMHPEEMPQLLPYLTDYDYDNPVCGVTAAALTDIGSPEAQKILMRAIDDSSDDLKRKEKLVAHLGLVEKITSEAEDKIYDIARNEQDDRIQGAAELAIGVIGGSHKESEVENRALNFATEKLEAATTDDDREHALRIFGNLGSPRQLELIKPFLTAAKESTQREAIRALRDVNMPEAHDILLGITGKNPSESLREVALESLSSDAQSDKVFQQLKTQLFQEKNDRVIRQILSHLANLRKNHPEARQVIEQFLSTCGRTDVCGFASSVLLSL